MIKTVYKRDGRKQKYDREKLKTSILRAFKSVDGEISSYAVDKANKAVEYIDKNYTGPIQTDELGKIVAHHLMSLKNKEYAEQYIATRNARQLYRGNVTDASVLELLEGNNEYWNSENSNKNATLVTTQRDYLAGISSTDITRRFLLPKDIVEAHDAGIIHFHDADYFAQNTLHNCDLINLEDMLQNGTVINEVLIEKPHRFLTAMTIATQIITAVASSQYGGCTITLTHLAPFVRDSKNVYLEKYRSRGLSEEQVQQFATEDLKKEIEDGVQTFNYQVNSMTTTNGQAPFLSVNMYLGETDEYKEELALLIEEFLKQRITGLKNKKGQYITQAFPKLLYVLEEDNIREDGKYYYLTELAAKCTAKRMVPDYISEKVMKELKGDVYPCMGCRSFLTPDRTTKNYANALNYVEGQHKYYGRLATN